MENSTIDYSNFGEEHSDRSKVISYMVVHAVSFLLGITGNGLVIWFGIFRMKKTVSLVWFLSLAVADFTFAFPLPLSITNIALGHWPFGSFMCRLCIFIFFFNKSVIALQLAVLCVDRCVRVTFPRWCHNHRTRRLALILVLIICIFCSPSSLILSIYSDTSDYFCYFGDHHSMNLHFLIRFPFFCLVPFLIIVCSYIQITLYSLIKHLPLCSRSFTVTLTVSIIFFVCYCPHNVFFLQGIHVINYYYVTIAECLLAIGSCINPIICILIGWEVKENFCSSFQTMFEKAFAEDDFYIGLNNREDRTVSLNLEGLSH